MTQRFALVPLLLALIALGPSRGTATKLDEIGYPCVLVPASSVELAPLTDGVVAELLVGRGDAVVQGQVVARLERRVEAAELALAEARAEQGRGVERARVQLEEARRRVERLAPLAELGIASKESYDEAQVQFATVTYDLQEAQMNAVIDGLEADRARARFDQRELRSPITGVVVDRHLEVGELALRAGESVVIEIAAVSSLRADVRVPLALFDAIEEGSAATVRFELSGGQERSARVSTVDRVADAGSGTIRVRIEIDNADGSIPAGTPARVLFDDLR